MAPWETRGTALRYTPLDHPSFHFLIQPIVVDNPDFTYPEFMALYESDPLGSYCHLQNIVQQRMPCTMAIKPEHIKPLMHLLYCYSAVEFTDSTRLINKLTSDNPRKTYRTTLMPCNRIRRRTTNFPLPLGQIPAALPIAVVKPELVPTQPRALLRRPPVRRSVAWFVDFKNDSNSHSVPPIEVVRPESPTLLPPSLVKSPVFDELPVALRALYQSAAAHIKPINGQSSFYRPVAPPIAITISDEPKEESNELSTDPVSIPQQPGTAPDPINSSANAPDSSDSLVSLQSCVIPFIDRPERPLAIARVVLIAPTIASDNTQGKSSRYKSAAKPQPHTHTLSTAVSNPAIDGRRLRLAVVPNDNTDGKSSRFKRLIIKPVRPLSTQLSLTLHHTGHIRECVLPLSLITSALSRSSCHLGHVIERVLFTLRSFCITMIPSTSPGFQALCYLRKDPPPYRRTTPLPPSTETTLPQCSMTPPPPSIVSTFPPLQILPLNQRSSFLITSMLPPSNVARGHQPSNVCYVRLPLMPQPSNVTLLRLSYNAPLPLPTMLTAITISLPLNSLALPLQSHTCHRTSAIINSTTLATFLQFTHNSSKPDAWPSGATVTCLPTPDPVPPRHVRDEQLVLEFLRRTIC